MQGTLNQQHHTRCKAPPAASCSGRREPTPPCLRRHQQQCAPGTRRRERGARRWATLNVVGSDQRETQLATRRQDVAQHPEFRDVDPEIMEVLGMATDAELEHVYGCLYGEREGV